MPETSDRTNATGPVLYPDGRDLAAEGYIIDDSRAPPEIQGQPVETWTVDPTITCHADIHRRAMQAALNARPETTEE